MGDVFTFSITVTDTASHHNLGLNQQIYQRLKAALELNLRRQIFVAVCDDLSLRNQLATRLHGELAYPAQVVAAQRTVELPYPRLVSLNLSLDNPDPMDQVAFWLEQNPPPQGSHLLQAPAFQVLGVERLTRQPPTVQRLFLSNLQRIEQLLPALESSLLIWIPRPWSRVIQQSAPEFWRWHTGVFEFEGEPTPVPAEGDRSKTECQPVGTIPPDSTPVPKTPVEPLPALTSTSAESPGNASMPASLPAKHSLPISASAPSKPIVAPEQPLAATHEQKHPPSLEDSITPSIPAASQAGALTPAQKESLWNILTHDLSQLSEQGTPQRRETVPPPLQTPPQSVTPPIDLETLETHPLETPPPTAPKREQTPPQKTKPDFAVPQQPQQQPRRSEPLMPPAAATPTGKLSGAGTPTAKSSQPPSRPAKTADPSKTPGSVAKAPMTVRAQSAQVPLPTQTQSPTQTQPPTQPQSAQSLPTGKLAEVSKAPDSSGINGIKEKPRSVVAQSQAALDLADFVLASITQENQTAQSPSESNGTANGHKARSHPLQALENIEQLHLQQAPPAALAAAYRSLGNLYRDRIEQGDASQQNLMISIRSYEQALVWLDESSSLWSDILNDIGNLYWMLSHSPGRPENALRYLEKGIQAYQTALSKTNPETRAHSYAMIQNNLGSAYGDLARYRDASEHLQRSIQAYQEALRYRDASSEPQRYAATQNNLGTAYWNLAQHDKPIVNLSQAIAAYNQALHHYDPDREPLSYAMIQNNLGTAYWNLAQFEQNTPELAGALDASSEDFLRLAIGAYRVALIYRTAEVNPSAYAATQNNLGTAYWHLANQPTLHYEECRECLQFAIVAYKAALETVQQMSASNAPLSLSFDRFATHNNLGLALHQLAIDKHCDWDDSIRTTHLEEALQHHVQALQGWQSKPDFYQTALGYIVQTIRTFYNLYGISGQTSALSKVPGSLLSEILSKL